MKTIYKPKYEQIIQRLRDARRDAGLKQDRVASKIGRYQSYLSKIENGDRRIDILELIELAQIYDKDINYFIKPEDKSKKKNTKAKKRKSK